MIIRPLEKKDEETFSEYSLEYGTIFCSLEWLSIFKERILIFGIYDNDHKLAGGFGLFLEKRVGLSIYRTPPFASSIGPFVRVDAKSPTGKLDIWKKVLSGMADFFEKLPYSIVSVAFHRDIVDMQPFIWKKFRVVPRYTYLLDLSEDVRNLSLRMSVNRRNDVNKGLRDGLRVEQTHDFDIIRTLVEKSFARQGKKVNDFYLKRILYDFAAPQNSYAFVTFRDEDPIACSFFLYDKECAYYLLGGYDPEKKHHGAGAMAIWEGVKFAKGLNLRYFDFEGSMVPSIEKFFRGFGGAIVPYYSIHKAKLLIEIAMKFSKRKIC